MKKGFTPILILVIVLVLAGIGFVAYQSFGTNLDLTLQPPSPSSDPTANWKVYTNTLYNYKIELPTDWKVDDEISGEAVTFESGAVLIYTPENNPPGNFFTGIRIEYVGMLVDFTNLTPVTKNSISMYQQDTMHGENYYINIPDTDSFLYVTGTGGYTDNEEYNSNVRSIFSTFEFCKPRPACLDSSPRCMVPETPDMCLPL